MPNYTPYSRQRLLQAQRMLDNSVSQRPITHWMQGVGRLGQAYFGNKMRNEEQGKFDQLEAGKRERFKKALGLALNGNRGEAAQLLGNDYPQAALQMATAGGKAGAWKQGIDNEGKPGFFRNRADGGGIEWAKDAKPYEKPDKPQLGAIAKINADEKAGRITAPQARDARRKANYMRPASGTGDTNTYITTPNPEGNTVIFRDLEKGVKSRREDMRVVKTSLRLLNNIETGTGAERMNDMRKIGQFLNFPVDDALIADTEAFKAETLKFTMKWISQTKGAISEPEMNLFEKASPNLANSKMGNGVILKLMAEAIRRADLVDHKMMDWLAANQDASHQDRWKHRRALESQMEKTSIRDIFTNAEWALVTKAAPPRGNQSATGGDGGDRFTPSPADLEAAKAERDRRKRDNGSW